MLLVLLVLLVLLDLETIAVTLAVAVGRSEEASEQASASAKSAICVGNSAPHLLPTPGPLGRAGPISEDCGGPASAVGKDHPTSLFSYHIKQRRALRASAGLEREGASGFERSGRLPTPRCAFMLVLPNRGAQLRRAGWLAGWLPVLPTNEASRCKVVHFGRRPKSLLSSSSSSSQIGHD